MSVQMNVVAEYYAGFNRREPGIYERLFASECELIAPGLRVRGRDAMRGFDQAWSAAFSEARIETLKMIEVDGTVLAANWFHGGTHVGPLPTAAGPIPAGGRTFSAPYTATFEVVNGRIKQQRILFDADHVPVALGAAPAGRVSNADVVTAIYDAFGRGDIPGVLNRLDPSVELRFEGPSDIPWAGTWLGREGWGKFFQALGSNMADVVVSVEPFAVDGEKVVAAGRYQARIKRTGQTIDSPLVHLWTVRNGMVVACTEMTNTAVEAAACAAAAVVA